MKIVTMTAIALLSASVFTAPAFAQTSGAADAAAGVSGSVGGIAGGVAGGADASADVGASGNAGANVGSGSGTSGSVSGSGDASGGATANSGSGTSGTVSGSSNVSGTANANTGNTNANVDGETTASVGLSAEENAAMDSMGDSVDGFFTDDTRSQVRSEDEVRFAFSSLTVGQQEQIRQACTNVTTSGASETMAGLCATVSSM